MNSKLRIPLCWKVKPGQTGPRVALLRERLGLEPGDGYDGEVAERVSAYRHAHGLGEGIAADAATIASLNKGAEYYEQLIQLNLERLRALPQTTEGRYILVDAAAARLWLYERGRPADSMKVVVGKAASPTPMLATQVRWAEYTPYWNVPPNLVQKTIAPNVLRQGVRYLASHGYEVLSDWSSDAQPISPGKVNWAAVARGKAEVRVRQQPSDANAMGEVKFLIRNDFGVYLHDTPNKELFAQDDRWQSNGCVRLEDAPRLARWLFNGAPPQPSGTPGEVVPLSRPVPVYITYLTAAPEDGSLVFRADRYGRDAPALAKMNEKDEVQTASLEQ